MLSERDFIFLVEHLMPECRDINRMVYVLSEDQDILEGMISDPRLFSILKQNPEIIIDISPHLLFAVLLNKAREEISQRSYTIEREKGSITFVFDSEKVLSFLEEEGIQDYLINMLSSFIRINSSNFLVRLKKGIWQKYRVSDFDIDYLERYAAGQPENLRFSTYKRIGDICLFIIGLFPEIIGSALSRSSIRKEHRPSIEQKSSLELIETGKHFYELASQQSSAEILSLSDVLFQISLHFPLAAKPLRIISDNYFGFLQKSQ